MSYVHVQKIIQPFYESEMAMLLDGYEAKF